MTDEQKINAVNDIINRMRTLFGKATPDPKMTRNDYINGGHARKYMDEKGIIKPGDFSFRLTAQDIIDMHVPMRVVGCTGRAKVFCHFAREMGLECWVVSTARFNNPDRGPATMDSPVIDGHQIVAIKDASGKLIAFDPGRDSKPIDGEIAVGNWIKSVSGHEPYQITAITPRDEFAGKINSLSDLMTEYKAQLAKTILNQKLKIKRLDLNRGVKNIFANVQAILKKIRSHQND